MLSNIRLDTEGFEDIAAQAVKKISVLYPQWTDYNYHDPGITILELFAWLKEIQQYYLEQTNSNNIDVFFNLLGMCRQHKRGACVRLEAAVDENSIVPAGSRFYAEDIVFETIERKYVIAGNLKGIVIQNQEEVRRIEGISAHAYLHANVHANMNTYGSHKLGIYPFGRKVEEGNALYLIFDNPLPMETELSIFFNTMENEYIARNPIGGFPFYALSQLSYEYFAGDAFVPMRVKRDETYGMIQDGSIFFTIDKGMSLTQVEGMEGYIIKLTVMKQEYDMAPLLSGISMNMIRAKQEETVVDYYDVMLEEFESISDDEVTIKQDSAMAIYGREKVFIYDGSCYREAGYQKHSNLLQKVCTYQIRCMNAPSIKGIRIVYFAENFAETFVGAGNRYSGQSFHIEETGLSYNDFEIMVEEEKGLYVPWSKQETLYHSGREERHYLFDDNTGTITFGDGVFGKCPEGTIRVIRLKKSRGSLGNVKAGTITGISDNMNEFTVTNEEAAWGGTDGENDEDAMIRFRRDLKAGKRIVTEEDYEAAVKNTPGLLIHSCKVIRHSRRDGSIEIAVKPYSNTARSKLGNAYERNILQYLEKLRLIGTQILLRSPEYIEVELFADIYIKSQYAGAEKEVKQRVKEYFEERLHLFGKPVMHHAIVALLEKTEAVSYVSSLTMTTNAQTVTVTVQGDLQLPAYGITVLKDMQFLCRLE